VYPTRGEVYIKTRTRKDGTIVDDEAAHVVVMYYKVLIYIYIYIYYGCA